MDSAVRVAAAVLTTGVVYMTPWPGRGQRRPPAARPFRPFRNVIFWLHLASGVVAGAVVLVMSVTGVLLTFERQILEWADRSAPGHRVTLPSPGTPQLQRLSRLPVETLIGKASGKPSSVIVQADPAAPVAVSLGRERTVYVDPYTGQVLGEGAPKVRAFFHAVTDWHRALGAEGERRDLGRAVTGACNLAFLVLVVSGLYLWLPRRWSWAQVRGVLWFRRGLPGKARDFNWHNVIGFWSWGPLFLIVLTGVVLSYPWASGLLYRLAGEEPPPARQGPPGGGGRGGREEGPVELGGLNELWAVAERQVPGWRTITMRLPGSPEDPVTFSILQGHRGRPDLRSQLSLDRATGEVEKWEPYASQSTGRRLRTWSRWVHTGEAGGVIGQTVAGLVSAGAVVLVWTGIALACRRFFPAGLRKKKTFSRPAGPAVSITVSNRGESQEELS
jgi:uncharacterized iron-regulated membrane protein